MQKTTATETRTVVRCAEVLSLTGYSITAADAYGVGAVVARGSDRQIVEIIGDGTDQILNAVVAWIESRHRIATTDSLAESDLKRLAEAMDLEYIAATLVSTTGKD